MRLDVRVFNNVERAPEARQSEVNGSEEGGNNHYCTDSGHDYSCSMCSQCLSPLLSMNSVTRPAYKRASRAIVRLAQVHITNSLNVGLVHIYGEK